MFEHPYRIVVRGSLREPAREAFAGFHIEQTGSDTVLRGDLDQAALFGALFRVAALGLELVEVMRERDRDPVS